jgi:hypothetical protein
MSFRVMERVWHLPPSAIKPTDRSVLLALASHANDRGRSMFPSVARLAERTSLNPRTIQYSLRRLSKPPLDFLVVESVGPRGAVRYSINLHAFPDREPYSQSRKGDREPYSQSERPDRAPRSQIHEPRSEIREPRSEIREPRSTDPSLIRHVNPSLIRTDARSRRRSTSDDLASRFETFWSSYPRKVNKQAALKAWTKLRPDAALLARMMAALDWQRRSDQWMRDGGQFIPHPATWLNAKRWEDEPSRIPRLNANTVAGFQAAKEFIES